MISLKDLKKTILLTSQPGDEEHLGTLSHALAQYLSANYTFDLVEREVQTVQMSISHTLHQPLPDSQSNCTLCLWVLHIALPWACSDS